jgi:3-isopropylmalate/(R)-2-methylmalate dehydratase small subunit
MLAVELPRDQIDILFNTFQEKKTSVEVQWKDSLLRFSADAEDKEIPFAISGFDRALIEAGGWLEFADSRY